MKLIANNRRGGAALAAVLIMIILIAAGSAIMVVSGRGQIKEAKDLPVIADPESSKPDESSSPDESSLPDDTSSEPEPETKLPEPARAANFQEIDFIKDDLATKNAMLLNVTKNEIVAGKNYTEKIYPASLTKIMTLIVAVENINDPSVEYKFTADKLAPLVEEKASVVGFLDGESIPFEDLLYGAVLVSGADATQGIASLVAGSEAKFVDMMNAKAEMLGLKNTHFVNTSGLHDDNHYSTCEDMAMLFAYALKNKMCRDVLSAATYTTVKTEQHPEGILLYSIVHSRFTGYWIDSEGAKYYVKGGKSGFTDEAGYALETFLEKNGETYIAINAMTPKEFGDEKCTMDNIAIYEKYLPKTK
ncbi:MAG: D-alanyl-D-alanine carboxypeptidase [Ruminococcus sp.]|nr:D-alanyl-D-alanine carboxypeptidase [Ruminococcus sp.]